MSEITNNPAVPTQIVGSVKFPNFITNLGIIPTSYKDSMSYYECLAWLCKFLEETVIPTVNQNGQAVEELQALYVELNSYVTNYFDNLDVQEEINNKLDNMVEQGTLQEIISTYLDTKAIFTFDNIEELKDATNLINGSYAKTLGYYSKNDNGGAIYKIVEDTPDKFYITLDSGLYAEYIPEGVINLVQLGLKENDNTFDNSAIFDIVENYYNDYKLFIPAGDFYFLSRIKLSKVNLEMTNETNLILNSSNTIECFIKIRTDDELGYYIGNKIVGGCINCNNKANTGIGFNNSRLFEISTKIYNFNSVGINTCFQTKTSTMLAGAGSFIHNCIFINETEKLSTTAILDNGNDNQFNNIVVQDVVVGVDLGPGSSVHTFHHWLSNVNLFDTSVTIKIHGGMNIITDLIVDTIATAVEYSINYAKATISGILYYLNNNVVSGEYLETHTPSVFKLMTQNSMYVNNSLFRFGNNDFKLFDDTSYSVYNTSHFDTLHFITIENSIYEQATKLTNILVSPLNGDKEFNSILGQVNMDELTRSTDFDTITKTGIYPFNTYSGSGGNNIPLSSTNMGGVLLVIGGKSNKIQIAVSFNKGKIAMRCNYGGTWEKWHDYTGTIET